MLIGVLVLFLRFSVCFHHLWPSSQFSSSVPFPGLALPHFRAPESIPSVPLGSLLGYYTKPLISFPSGLKSCKLPLVAFAFSACGSWLGFFCSLNSWQRAPASLRSHLDCEHVSFTGSVVRALRHLASRQYIFRCV